ncbi:MAG: YggS family pyridoxal phosphate-dependent enzyme [Mobilicoccus sp.]|nr:YggS family pyridoxal phosphate-dependent enzyme [Mobilicoccus sp.]
MGDRAAILAERLAATRTRLGDSGATLVVVTKFFPASDVRILRDLGVTDIGENRDQEASAKVAELDAAGERPERVHFIGQIQSNKAASIARYADVVQSVDREKIVSALEKGARAADRRLEVLLQVDLDGDAAGRGGVAPSALPALAERAGASDVLTLRGLMAVAPLGWEPERAFGRLAELHEQVMRDHPGATWRSAGMSGDLEAALAHGATHVRVGSAILGDRPRAG